MISHDVGCLMNHILITSSIGKLMLSFSGSFFCSTLMIAITMKFSIFWSLYLASVSTLIFFPVSVVVSSHISASVMMLLY